MSAAFSKHRRHLPYYFLISHVGKAVNIYRAHNCTRYNAKYSSRIIWFHPKATLWRGFHLKALATALTRKGGLIWNTKLAKVPELWSREGSYKTKPTKSRPKLQIINASSLDSDNYRVSGTCQCRTDEEIEVQEGWAIWQRSKIF